MAKRKRYTDEFRASAVLMLEAAGYPEKKGALARVANKLGVPARTLSRWFKRTNNPPPINLVDNRRDSAIALFDELRHSALDELEIARKGASMNDLALLFTTLVDRHYFLTGGHNDN